MCMPCSRSECLCRPEFLFEDFGKDDSFYLTGAYAKLKRWFNYIPVIDEVDPAFSSLGCLLRYVADVMYSWKLQDKAEELQEAQNQALAATGEAMEKGDVSELRKVSKNSFELSGYFLQDKLLQVRGRQIAATTRPLQHAMAEALRCRELRSLIAKWNASMATGEWINVLRYVVKLLSDSDRLESFGLIINGLAAVNYFDGLSRIS